jgi:autophagy-related protein 9
MDSLILTQNLGNTKTPDDIFIRRLYNYFYKGGFRNIVVENIITLLINYFLILFINFLTNCVDYEALANLTDGKHDMSEFIDLRNLFPKSPYLIICFVVYTIYLVCETINTITTIKIAWAVKKIYAESLGIVNLQQIRWSDITKKIMTVYNDSNINPYTIASKIMRQDNITISLFRNCNLVKPRMTKSLEMNYIYCFVNPLFDVNGNITKNTIANYKAKVKNNLKLVFAINIIALPFIIYIILIYSIIKYGEKFYHHPELISQRQWTVKAKWRLRYYNELPHQYNRRKDDIGNILTKILNCQGYHATASIIIRFINFIMGSFFILLVGMSLINDNILTDCLVAGNKNVLWFIGIIGAFILICRKATNIKGMLHKEKEDKLFNSLSKYIRSIHPRWFYPDIRPSCVILLSSLYQYKIKFVFMEIWNVIWTAYYIYNWFKDVDNIDLCDILEESQSLGYIDRRSQFNNLQTIIKQPHTYASIEQFKFNNPKWHSAHLWYQQAIDSCSIIEGDSPTFDWSKYELNKLPANRVNPAPQFNNMLSTTIIFGNQ